jgi:chitin-binding protein
MYNVVSAWTGGFQGEVMVHAGTTPVNGWTVNFTWPGTQTLAQVWNGKSTSSGSLVTVHNESYNGSIAAGNYTTFGFLGSGTAPPTVQNLTCASP